MQAMDSIERTLEAVRNQITLETWKQEHTELIDRWGGSLLHTTCEYGYQEIVEILLASNPDLELVDNTYRRTALHIVASTHHDSIMRLLLSKEANVNAKDKEGYTPLHFAAKFGQGVMIQLLLEHGAPLEAKNGMGFAPLNLALFNDREDAGLILLQKGANINTKDTKGWTPLHWAAFKGDIKRIKMLLTTTDYPGQKLAINQLDMTGNTPLHIACSQGHLATAELLIPQKANVKLINKDSNTPFHLACASGNAQLVEFLIAHDAELQKPNRVGNTPLHSASIAGHTDVVLLLLAQGVALDPRNAQQETPLLCALHSKSVEVMEALLEYGASIDVVDLSGDSLVMAASKQGLLSVVGILLKKAPQLLNTTFFDACAAGHEKVIELLIKQGMEVDACNSQGLTGLQLAVAAKKENIILVLLKHQAKSEIDLREWACRNGCLELLTFSMESTKELDLSTGYMLLDYAAAYPEIVEYLVTLLSKNGIIHSALLFEACKKGNTAIIKCLAALNIRLDVIDEEGNTLLHFAPDAPMIQLLLACGCKAEAKNSKGLTSLEIACMTGNTAKIIPFRGQVTLHHFWLAFHAGQIDMACFLAKSSQEFRAAISSEFTRKFNDTDVLINCLKSGKTIEFSQFSADVRSKALGVSDYLWILEGAMRDNKTEIINLIAEIKYHGHSILYGIIEDEFKKFLAEMNAWYKIIRRCDCPSFQDYYLREILEKRISWWDKEDCRMLIQAGLPVNVPDRRFEEKLQTLQKFLR